MEHRNLQTSRRTFLGLLKTNSSKVFPTTIWMLASSCNFTVSKIFEHFMIIMKKIYPEKGKRKKKKNRKRNSTILQV